MGVPVAYEGIARATALRQPRFERVCSLISNGEFELEFQPIVGIGTDRVVGVEALARFPTEPRRSPEAWFGEAVSVGLGTELDMAVAQKALRILLTLPRGVDLFLSVRPDSIFSSRFAELMACVRPNSLVIEIAEHVPAFEYEALKAFVGAMRDSGFRILVDDAVAGYASLRHLLDLRPDMLKIDASLCRSVETDRERQAHVRALVSVGRELGATVVAKGIETSAELRAVRDLGVDGAQGDYLGAPAPAPLDDMLAGAVGHDGGRQ
jgi:EAL domain-containing protein (putative c-di-GMP-specific phosphodiesterase class I)